MKKQEKLIYLDSAATTRIHPFILENILKHLKNFFGNPSSLHKLGVDTEQIVKTGRNQIADILKVHSSNIFFTSGATESNNWAIESSWISRNKKGTTLLASTTAHPSITKKLESMMEKGASVNFIPVDKNGILKLEVLEKTLNPTVIFFSILWVNNETGVIQPLSKIIPLIRKKAPHCFIHVDGAQAFCKIPDISDIKNVDFFSLNAHKIGGEKGCGALFVKNSSNLIPLMYGGGQEKNKRAGTENVSGIYGFALAAQKMHQSIHENYRQMTIFQQKFESSVKNVFPDAKINSEHADRSPYISSISLKNIKGEVLVHALAEKNIYISTGSACSSKKEIYSKVLKAMHVSKDYLPGSIRISFFPDLKETEINHAISVLIETVQLLMPVIQRKKS